VSFALGTDCLQNITGKKSLYWSVTCQRPPHSPNHQISTINAHHSDDCYSLISPFHPLISSSTLYIHNPRFTRHTQKLRFPTSLHRNSTQKEYRKKQEKTPELCEVFVSTA
jgi:hypothetical protein